MAIKEEDLAYDGSSDPQKRELTPRERDILVRIIRTALVSKRMIIYPEEVDTLKNVIEAIDPRAS